jgi:hypothetical protein
MSNILALIALLMVGGLVVLAGLFVTVWLSLRSIKPCGK